MLFLKHKIGSFAIQKSFDTLYVLLSDGRKAERGQRLLNIIKIYVKISVPLSLKSRLEIRTIILGEKNLKRITHL